MAKVHKIEGGQGGKLGHSNMSHRTGTEEIKDRSKLLRRRQSREMERKAVRGESE